MEKQGRLNEIETVVLLSLHQVMYVDEASASAHGAAAPTLPADLNGALVFEYHNLIRLQRRIRELEEEIEHQKIQKRCAFSEFNGNRKCTL